jgi:hypothetical protein
MPTHDLCDEAKVTSPMDKLYQAQQLAAAAARRRLIADWLERHEAMRAIRPRNDEERLAAVVNNVLPIGNALLAQARPGVS